MASCVLVAGLDASTNPGEMTSLFESAGTLTHVVVVAPAGDGRPGAALVYFAEPRAAAEAADMFDSHPFAGRFLEVNVADATAAARVVAALAEVQHGAVPGSGAGAGIVQASSAPPAPTTHAMAVTTPAAAPAISFGTGASVPMPQPFSSSAPAFGASSAAPSTALSAAPSASTPEPPEFGGSDYNAADWLPPSDWQPQAPAGPAPASSAAPGCWAAAAAGGATRPSSSRAAPPAGGRPAGASSAPVVQQAAPAPVQAGAKQPEWNVDKRCRIFMQGLRYGVSADDLKSYFSKFGPLIDTSVVPKQQIGFLTFAKGDDGQAALEAVHNTSVPGLSPSGSDALRLEYRDLEKIQKHLHGTRRNDVVEQPTTRLFVGYLPRSSKARDVETELQRYGEIIEVVLGGGQDGGERFCFVQFRRVQDAARAKNAIHGHTLPTLAGSRTLIAAFKEPKRGY